MVNVKDYPKQCEFKNQKEADKTKNQLKDWLITEELSYEEIEAWKNHNEKGLTYNISEETKDTLLLQIAIYEEILSERE